MKIIIVGGAGFIGSYCAEQLLIESKHDVTVFDNFSSGRRWHIEPLIALRGLKIISGDAQNLNNISAAMRGHELVFHFASNPDIAKAATDPTIDFFQGTLLTQNVLEAARRVGVSKVIYASGSGIFGDNASKVFSEADFSPCPNSTYAASKIAGETMLSAYCSMFGMQGISFRFANVVGERQTHGVAFDFIKKLRKNPAVLEVMGNGTQTKSYIHVTDVVAALLHFLPEFPRQYDYFNLTTSDSLTVKQIADLVVKEMGMRNVEIKYGDADRGWAGDVPRIRFTADKIRSYGWSPKHNSLEAMRMAIQGMLDNTTKGIFD